MAKKGLFGSKGPLIYATVVSLICVMSASISTFAWFQAEANVQIQTTSTSTSITVAKPDDVALADPTIYAYNDNFTYSGGVYSNHGYNTAADTNKVSMLFEKGASANWLYSNGSGSSKFGFISYVDNEQTVSMTKLGVGGSLSVIPESGWSITSVVFTSYDSTRANNLEAHATWHNGGTPAQSGNVVTVTPNNGQEAITAEVGTSGSSATIWLTSVLINYENVSSGLTSNITWNLASRTYSYCGDDHNKKYANATANYVEGDYSSDTIVWTTASPAIITRDFTELNTSAKKSALLNTSMLSPGYKLTFAIKAQTDDSEYDGTISSASMYINEYTSSNMLNRKILSAVGTLSANTVRIDSAIRIYSSVNTSGWYFGSSVNQFDYNQDIASITPDVTSVDSAGNVQTRNYDSNAANSEFSPYEIGSSESINATTVYLFFTIELSNDNGTYYVEYDGSGNNASSLNVPASDYEEETVFVSGHKYYTYSAGVYTYAPSATSAQVSEGGYYVVKNRYFLLGTAGNSNCYSGLTFAINEIGLSFA